MIKTVILIFSAVTASADCSSRVSAYAGDWKPIASAPRDGTVIEIMNTYGVAPWYGLFKWTKERAWYQSGDKKTIFFEEPAWMAADREGHMLSSDDCLYWRPYKYTGKKYVDPTGGAQDKIQYWCEAMHRPYDPKKDVCK